MELVLDWKSLGSLFATFVFIRTAIRDFMPPEVYQFLKLLFSKVFTSLQPNVTILIEEFESSLTNELFDAAQSYLSTKCFSSSRVLKLSKPKNFKNLTFTMSTNQTFEEMFEGIKVKWTFCCVEKKTNSNIYRASLDNRYFQLSFHHKYKEKVQSSYIPYVIEVAETIKLKNRERKLYTNRSFEEDGRYWSFVPFSHPSTFDTLAFDPVLKEDIKADLTKFIKRKEFYGRVGRAWKRGYLLYGPPGTGKTSLIAAIANFLEFDIYDLELTSVRSNSQLRKLLISISSKSVVVVEDIDCSLDLSDRSKKAITAEENGNDTEEGKDKAHRTGSLNSFISLSGVLNFVDGLWSSCGGERLIIFTTNHKEKLDQALLRPGRMDKHINLSYCENDAFKMLAKNYLGIEKHELMKDVEEVLPLIKMTPADIGEIFLSCEEDADMGMKRILEKMVEEKEKQCRLTIEDSSINNDKNQEQNEDSVANEDGHKIEERHDDNNKEKEDVVAEKQD